MAINFPDSPSVNDTHTVLGKTWVWNGTYWKLSGSSNRGISLQVSDTAPSDPVSGDMWYESDTGRTFTYYDGAWIELGNTASVTAFLADADADTLVHVEESADSDTIAFTTGGTKRLEIDASGHVIPAANETYDLGSASNRFRDIYLSGTTIDLGGVEISSDGTSLTMPPVSNISGDFTVGTDVLHVDHANSRVGIGTTTPTVALQVDSGSTDQYAAPQIYIAPSGHASSDRAAIQLDDIQLLTDIFGNGTEDFSIYSNGAASHRLVIDSSGNVGIGTTTPSYKLDVEEGVASTSQVLAELMQPSLADGNSNQIYIGKSAGTNTSATLTYTYNSSVLSSSMLSLGLYGSSNTLNIAGSGNVGIGTTAPLAKLSFANSTGNKVDFYHTTTSSGDRYGVQVHSSELRIHSGAAGNNTGGITLGKSSTSTFTENMRVRNDGIITTPYQPTFSVYETGGTSPVGPTQIILTDVSANRGGHYSTSNGRFTAPADGMYFFIFQAFIEQNSATVAYYNLRINGAITGYRSYTNFSTTAYRASSGVSAVFTLSTGDYVDVYLGGGTLHGNDAMMFSGFLVG
jgi:hypothetical protein